MACNNQIPIPEPMSLRGDIVENWRYFKKRWNNYVVSTGLVEKKDNVKLATFYSVIGREGNEIADNLIVADPNQVDSVIEALSDHFEPQKNVIFDRYKFNSAMQEAEENTETYVNRLRKLVSRCDYGTLTDELIRDKLVIGTKEKKGRDRLLREPKLTLIKAVEQLKILEQTQSQLKLLSPEPIHIDKITKYSDNITNCKYCGSDHKVRECPAYGKFCKKCNKKNHFAKICRSRQPVTSYNGRNPRKVH